MTPHDAASRLAERHRIEQARALMEAVAASLPPGDWLRQVLERGLAEDAEAAAADARNNAPPDAKTLVQ